MLVSSLPRVIKHCRRSGMVTTSTSLTTSEFWVFYSLTVTSCYMSAANIQSGFTFEFHRNTTQLFILYCNSYFILHDGEARPSEAGQLTTSANIYASYIIQCVAKLFNSLSVHPVIFFSRPTPCSPVTTINVGTVHVK